MEQPLWQTLTAMFSQTDHFQPYKQVYYFNNGLGIYEPAGGQDGTVYDFGNGYFNAIWYLF